MGLPFIIVEATSLLVDVVGNIADIIPAIAGKSRLAVDSSIVGNDGLLRADVITKNFRNALVTDASVTVEQVFGFDDFADSWVRIDTSGAIGDTVRVQIAGFTDPTGSERDMPAVDYTYTLISGDVDKELILRDSIVAGLNNDANFIASSWKATVIKDNPIIHIGSKLIGEEGERPVSGDFIVTPTGTTTTSFQNSDNDKFVRRGKQNSGARDPRDRRLVTIGISGEVQAVPGAAGDLFFQNATDNGTPIPDQGGTGDANLLVNGSLATPIEFTIPADNEKDVFISEMRFFGGGNGIQYSNFLSKASSLTNGITVTIRSDEVDKMFFPLRATEDFKNKWSFGSGANFKLETPAGTDQFLAVLQFENPFPLRKTGTFLSGDDFIKVEVRDNLTAGITELEFLAVGFKREV